MAHAPTPNSDVTHYAILCAHQHSAGYFAERSLEDSCSRATLIDDIISGNLTRVMKVFAFNSVEHTCDDVTEEIAMAVADLIDPNDMPSGSVIDFIQAHAGLEYTRGLRAAE